MKTLPIYLLFISVSLTSRLKAQPDSVSVRILNQGRYYLKTCTIVVNDKKYIFKDICKGRFSAPQKLPYVWSINNIVNIMAVRKRFLTYADWMNVIISPIDHIGDKQYTKGKVLLTVLTKRKKKKLITSEILTQDY